MWCSCVVWVTAYLWWMRHDYVRVLWHVLCPYGRGLCICSCGACVSRSMCCLCMFGVVYECLCLDVTSCMQHNFVLCGTSTQRCCGDDPCVSVLSQHVAWCVCDFNMLNGCCIIKTVRVPCHRAANRGLCVAIVALRTAVVYNETLVDAQVLLCECIFACGVCVCVCVTCVGCWNVCLPMQLIVCAAVVE